MLTTLLFSPSLRPINPGMAWPHINEDMTHSCTVYMAIHVGAHILVIAKSDQKNSPFRARVISA
jgi:hypothetical protein